MAKLFLDGALIDAEVARIAPDDRGFLLGDGLFETLRARTGRLFRAEAHLARLAAGARELGIPLPVSAAGLRAALFETLAANRLGAGEAVLRITLSRGPGPRGLVPPEAPTPTLLITAARLSPAPDRPAALHLAAGVRRNERSPASRLKTLNVLDAVIARREAAARGADEALMLNTAGRLAEASAANLFLVSAAGAVLTPPVAEGALPGITRAAVCELARDLRIELREAPLGPCDLEPAGECFLTNAVIGLRPVAAIDAWRFEAPGPVTRRLARAFAGLVAREARAADQLVASSSTAAISPSENR